MSFIYLSINLLCFSLFLPCLVVPRSNVSICGNQHSLDQPKLFRSCCCSVAQSRWTLCDHMDCSTPGLPVPHHLPKFAQVHVHCHPAISSSDALFSFCPQYFQASGTSPGSRLFISGNQNTWALASASALPMCIQSWFLFRLTGLISLLSKGLSGVFCSTTVWRHQFFSVLPSLWSSSHHHIWPLGRP